ncbi:hypothetical protein [Micromonospora echinospora]|uniref:hypothetical protein n=1 Tax=Micromonospora echinospora TaxID=1877 RepID=UPI003A8907E8
MPSPPVDVAAGVRVELSRDYEPAAARLPGMALGTRHLAGACVPAVAGWYREEPGTRDCPLRSTCVPTPTPPRPGRSCWSAS